MTVKSSLRLLMKSRREAAQRENPRAALDMREIFMRHFSLPPRAVVAGYIPHQTEIDPAPLMQALHVAGHPLALPVAKGEKEPLIFRRYSPGDALAKHAHYSIREPLPAAAEIAPDIILVPLLAFDQFGHRLGYGGGHYDRTLAALRQRKSVMAIGLAFACQAVEALPTHDGDARLDKIVTENQVLTVYSAP